MIGYYEASLPNRSLLYVSVLSESKLQFECHEFTLLPPYAFDPAHPYRPIPSERIKEVPELILDERKAITVPKDVSKTSIYVVNSSHFLNIMINFKEGMRNVFRISKKILKHSLDDSTTELGELDFPLNDYEQVSFGVDKAVWSFEDSVRHVMKDTFLNQQYSQYVFRHDLADMFAAHLKRSRGKGALRFSCCASKVHGMQLFSSLNGTYSYVERSTNQHMHDILSRTHLKQDCIIRRLFSIQLSMVEALFPILGRFYYYHPISCMHFHGSVMRDHPCATLRTVHTELKIAYDLSVELLTISAPIECLKKYELENQLQQFDDEYRKHFNALSDLVFYDEDMQKHMKVVLVEKNSVSFNDLKKKNKRLSLVVV